MNLQAILADPLADAPRLDYARAIERKDPDRARLIRAQIELLRLSDNHSDRARALRSEINKLLRTHRREWIRDVLPLVDNCRLQRGFVEYVLVGSQLFLERADELRRRCPLLDVVVTGEVHDRSFFGSEKLAGLRSINLAKAGLTDDDVVALAASPHLESLRWLDLSFNPLGDRALEALASSDELPGLQYLGFRGCTAPDPTPEIAEEMGHVHYVNYPENGQRLAATYGERVWLKQTKDFGMPSPERV